ncbi:baculoviral iap repeat-containing protein 3 [Plakobranchus ocellatus]|uniref:Baculoviral iap repeat-containing protein 3 n=1 Tax=Plakobranchus ocellatus TaxID=259542 RepID=A0AAV4CQ55_9GAST|nr:baculoviral iap repeat-containing protein 3 [Plakobranchus ocellatus]
MSADAKRGGKRKANDKEAEHRLKRRKLEESHGAGGEAVQSTVNSANRLKARRQPLLRMRRHRLYPVRRQRRRTPLSGVQHNRPTIVMLESRALPTDHDVHRQNDIDLRAEKQKMRFKKNQSHLKTCRVCLRDDHSIKYINMPCGHMTTCQTCQPYMILCAECYTEIEHTVFCPVTEYDGDFCFLDWYMSREY